MDVVEIPDLYAQVLVFSDGNGADMEIVSLEQDPRLSQLGHLASSSQRAAKYREILGLETRPPQTAYELRRDFQNRLVLTQQL